MKRFLIAGIVQLMFFASSQAAICTDTPTITSNGTVCIDGSNATSILGIGIDLDGGGPLAISFYDVAFEFMVVGTLPAPGDIFNGNQTGATAAANAINAALTETTLVSTVGSGFTGFGAIRFHVPYLFDASACGDQGNGMCSQDGTSGFTTSWSPQGGETNNGEEVEFARFTPAAAPVPVPPAVLLFASGLALLGRFRRRNK